jgi:diguanylate cyclase (GGDEF)-like protein/PAS domain S-box-containing protein
MRISFQRRQISGFRLDQQLGKFWQQGLSLVLAGLITTGLWQAGLGQTLENWSYTAFLQWCSALPWNQTVVVIEIDQLSLEKIQLSPWSRQFYIPILERLTELEPAAVVLNTLFSGQEADDRDLAAAITRQGRVVLAQAWDANEKPILSSPVLLEAASAIGHVQQVPDADGITRYVTTEIAGVPTLGLAAIQVYTAYTSSQSAAHSEIPDSVKAPYQPIWLNWRDRLQQSTRYSLTALLANQIPPQRLRNKIVLVGILDEGPESNSPKAKLAGVKTAATLPTPFERSSAPVYLHATVISNLLQKDFLSRTSHYSAFLVLAVTTLILLGGTAGWSWLYQLLVWLGTCLSWAGLAWVEFNANTWMPIATPILWFSLIGMTLLLIRFLAAFQTLRRNETRYALVMQGFNEGIWDWDLKTNHFYFSPRWKQMLGYDEENFDESPQEWFERVHPQDRSTLEAAIAEYLAGFGAHFEHEYRLRHRDGSYRWMQSRGLKVYNAAGKPERLVGSQIDITAQKQAEEELWRSTFFDRLTELPSWTGFINYLQQAIALAQQEPRFRFAILWLDLDQFKLVNNTLGNDIGDRLLIAIAERLKSFLSSNEVVARLGEDEFAVLLQPIQDSNEAMQIAKQIQQVLAHPYKLDEHEVFVTASIGIALNAVYYQTPEHLLRDAGTAMYRAKAMGRASCLVFDKSMRTGMLVKLRLESDLRRAIAEGERQSQPALIHSEIAPDLSLSSSLLSQQLNGTQLNGTQLTAQSVAGLTAPPETVTSERYPELELYYQPIVRLATGEVTGFEALVRWQHAEQGLLFPSRFISMAEETGLIIPLSWWILRTACRQMSQWRLLFPEKSALTMSVNLSSKQFSMSSLTAQIQQILLETNLEPTYLKLELTESMVMENVASVVDVLYELRALGIRLAIDDFGTGYSSLSYLPRFPLTTLKIDRSFVERIDNCSDNLEIVRTILSLAHNLRMDVVAEGVETEAQALQLQQMGCEYGQGFFFYKPMGVEAATQLLTKQ